DSAQNALEEIDKKWREYNARMEQEKEEREAWNKEKGNLEAELQQIKAKLSFLGKDLLEIKDKKSNAADPRNDLDEQIKELAKERDLLLSDQERLLTLHGELYAKVQNLASELQRARREAGHARSKLNEIADSMQAEIYPRPVQFLLSSAKLNRLDAAPRAVIDVFNCDTSLSSALEAYLGGRQFQLLVEDLEEAGRCIDKLKTNAAGRATFLPLERCRPRFPDRSFRLPHQGIVGWAIELVQVEDHWLPAIQQIMGDLLIVESYGVGQSIVRSGFKGPVATLEGDVFQPGGTVSGGKSQKTGKALELKAQVAKLEAESEKASKNAERCAAEFKKAEADELSVAEQKESYTRRIRELDGRIALVADQKESYAKEQKRMEGERGRILAAIKDEGVKWRGILNALDELEEKWNLPSTVEDDHLLIEERERLRAESAVAAERLRSQFALMERVSNEIRTEEHKVWNLDEEISDLDQTCVRERSNLARVGKSCLEIHTRRKELVSEMESYVTGYALLEKRREYMQVRTAQADVRARGGM
ncbi:MAG: hypothetical protein RR214_05760, partial [Synergistaceae bacterium]